MTIFDDVVDRVMPKESLEGWILQIDCRDWRESTVGAGVAKLVQRTHHRSCSDRPRDLRGCLAHKIGGSPRDHRGLRHRRTRIDRLHLGFYLGDHRGRTVRVDVALDTDDPISKLAEGAHYLRRHDRGNHADLDMQS